MVLRPDAVRRQAPSLLPPVWLALAIMAMVALHFLLPPMRVLPDGALPWALLPMGVGCVLAAWGARLFVARETPVRPTEVPRRIVATGPYRFTRNPMYLGLILILVGLWMALGSPWPLVPVVAFAILMNAQAAREEDALEALFGDEYRAYRGRVRRWL